MSSPSSGSTSFPPARSAAPQPAGRWRWRDEALAARRTRPLGAFASLFLDARDEKARIAGVVRDTAIRSAVGPGSGRACRRSAATNTVSATRSALPSPSVRRKSTGAAFSTASWPANGATCAWSGEPAPPASFPARVCRRRGRRMSPGVVGSFPGRGRHRDDARLSWRSILAGSHVSLRIGCTISVGRGAVGAAALRHAVARAAPCRSVRYQREMPEGARGAAMPAGGSAAFSRHGAACWRRSLVA